MPSQFLNALVKLSIHLSLIACVSKKNLLQFLLGELQLAHLLGHMLAHIEQELIIAVLLELVCDQVLHLRTEISLCLHLATREHAVKQFLIEWAWHKTSDFCNLEVEFTLVIQSISLLDLQQRGQLSLVVVICH